MAIQLVAHLMLPVVMAACVAQASPPGPGIPAMSDVYGAMEWYRERSEPEQLFQGVLEYTGDAARSGRARRLDIRADDQCRVAGRLRPRGWQ